MKSVLLEVATLKRKQANQARADIIRVMGLSLIEHMTNTQSDILFHLPFAVKAQLLALYHPKA